MKLATTFITFNRLDYTKRTIESYLETVTVDHVTAVVDNGSSDETHEYLDTLVDDIDYMYYGQENYFPGWACNTGWMNLVEQWPDCTHLHRSDNDVIYKSGWDTYAEKCFEAIDNLGQLGLLPMSALGRDLREINDVKVLWHDQDNVGGLNIISRKVWDRGIRYHEDPWRPGQLGEDFFFSKDIRDAGYNIAVMAEELLDYQSGDQWVKYPDYDKFTALIRGVSHNWRQ